VVQAGSGKAGVEMAEHTPPPPPPLSEGMDVDVEHTPASEQTAAARPAGQGQEKSVQRSSAGLPSEEVSDLGDEGRSRDAIFPMLSKECEL